MTEGNRKKKFCLLFCFYFLSFVLLFFFTRCPHQDQQTHCGRASSAQASSAVVAAAVLAASALLALAASASAAAASEEMAQGTT